MTAHNAQITTPAILQDKYCYIRLLGEGSNGKTWLSKDLRDGSNVAIKELKDFDDFKQLDLFTREVEILQSIHTQGVPEYRESIRGNAEFYLVEEFVPYPSLQQLLDEGKKFDEATVLTIISRTAAILHVLETQYQPPIIHRDITPSNIMINLRDGNEMDIHLIDFGSVVLPEKQKEGSTIAGTFGYMPPEQLQ